MALATIVPADENHKERPRVGPIATTEPLPAGAPNAVDALSAMLADDLAAVEQVIRERMTSAVGLIPDLALYLIDAGGKRIRPVITLACARACAGETGRAPLLAAAVEFIHSATLLHDDVVDGSDLRRGKAPANRLWGNPASVLVGDFLFARAFDLMVDARDLDILGVLANAASVIAEGEVMQLVSARNHAVSDERYMAIIRAKTAELFNAAARVGVMATGAAPAVADAAGRFGLELGIAFQLADDALDYGGAANTMGKQVGDDFREGKVTLPVIVARDAGDGEEQAFWARTFGAGPQDEEDLAHAISLMRRRGAIAATVERARAHARSAREALAAFPPGPFRDALADLADFAADRAF